MAGSCAPDCRPGAAHDGTRRLCLLCCGWLARKPAAAVLQPAQRLSGAPLLPCACTGEVQARASNTAAAGV